MSEFTVNDHEVAYALYQYLTNDSERAVLDFLVDHPDERFDAAAIQKQLGFEAHRDVALTMYEIGRHCTALGKKRPWTEAQVGYLMPVEIALLFREVRA